MEVLDERGAVIIIHPHRPAPHPEKIIETPPFAMYEYTAEWSAACTIVEKKLSANIVDEVMLSRADYVGIVSAAAANKSGVFAWREGEAGTPIIDDSPLTMECAVVDNYET